MKKIVVRLCLGILAVVFIGYIALMAMFEGPIISDVSDQVQLMPGMKTISLPWYMNLGVNGWGVQEGIDAEGNTYSQFIYELPELFESAEMCCLVSWSDNAVKLYVGESRAMEVIDRDFDFVQWDRTIKAFPGEE